MTSLNLRSPFTSVPSVPSLPAIELLRNCTEGFVWPAWLWDLRRRASSTCGAGGGKSGTPREDLYCVIFFR